MMRLCALAAVVLLAAAAYLFPLSIALGIADFDRFGLEMQGVSGSVWEGRIEDATLRDQPLGSFTTRLDPAGLVAGGADLSFAGTGDAQRRLTGILRAKGERRGIVDANGEVPVEKLLAPLPVRTLSLTDATVLFDGPRCAHASGRVAGDVGISVFGYRIARSLTGDLSCDGEDVRIALRSATGYEQVDLSIAADGRYRAQMRVDARQREIAAGLALLGFRRDAGAMVASMAGMF